MQILYGEKMKIECIPFILSTKTWLDAIDSHGISECLNP